MDYQAEEIIVLKNSELMLLLAAAGISRWYGIDIGDVSDLDSDRSFNKNLAILYQKNIIDWKNGKATVPDPYRRMTEVLKKSPVCVTVTSEDRPHYITGYYFNNGDVVVINRRTAANDEIELSMQKYFDWLKSIKEDGVISEYSDNPEKNDETEMDRELINHIELRSVPDGELLETAEIFDKGLDRILERTIGNKTNTDYFTEKAFADMLNDWIGGVA